MKSATTDWDIEALSLDHGTIDSVRCCSKGSCRRCNAEQKLAAMGFVRKKRSRLSQLLHELADMV